MKKKRRKNEEKEWRKGRRRINVIYTGIAFSIRNSFSYSISSAWNGMWMRAKKTKEKLKIKRMNDDEMHTNLFKWVQPDGSAVYTDLYTHTHIHDWMLRCFIIVKWRSAKHLLSSEDNPLLTSHNKNQEGKQKGEPKQECERERNLT